jgi:hypothetical protein
MACAYCGQTYCLGGCLSGVQGVGIPPLQGQTWIGTTPLGQAVPPTDYALNDFLEIISDKSDTEACIVFIEKQKQLRDKQAKMLEEVQRQHVEFLEKSENDFMAKCQRYRPSITPEILERIKKMKAFY